MTVATCHLCGQHRWVEVEDEYRGRKWCSRLCMIRDLLATGEAVEVEK